MSESSLEVSAGQTLMELLREKRAAAAALKTIDLPIPGYGDELIARYKLLDPLIEGKEIGKRVSKQFPDDEEARIFYALVDTLLAACTGLYLSNGDGLEPIDPEGEGPVTYDHRLATGLQLDVGDPPSARATLIAVFNDNKAAIGAHAMRYQRWMNDPSRLPALGEA